MNNFSVIIPSRNAANLVPCVRAIRESGETCRIIVVDDGLDWPLVETLLGEIAHQPHLARVNGERPFIYARNINIGIRAAGDDDVILLNDDALLKTPLGFSKMQRMACGPKHYMAADFGVVASSCNNVGNPNQFQHNKIGKLEPVDGLREDMRTLCFVCVLIPRGTINAVGLLDERFVDYGLDDDDYSLRARNAGLKLGVFDGCFVDHGSLTSSFRGPAGRGGDFSANMRRFIEKWGTDNWGNDRAHSPFAKLFPTPEPPL